MSQTYTKTPAGAIKAKQLQDEININATIVPSCLSVTLRDNDLLIDMAGALSAGEETELDAVIAAHTPVVEDISLYDLPLSRTIDTKLAVHSSSKPEPKGYITYAVWAGAGDDPNAAEASDSLGNGELLVFEMTTQTGSPINTEVTKDIWFDPRHGRVWIHEAYIKFEGAGIGDYLTADVMAPGTQLQQVANLDLVVDGEGWISYAPGGPGTGTHGFAATPVLLPREFSKDGDWDWDGTNLTPNFGPGGSPNPGPNGGYKMNINAMSVHRYFNKIPLNGTVHNYFTMSSDETAELPVDLGFFIRVRVNNVSNGNWTLSCIMEIFRERTIDP